MALCGAKKKTYCRIEKEKKNDEELKIEANTKEKKAKKP